MFQSPGGRSLSPDGLKNKGGHGQTFDEAQINVSSKQTVSRHTPQ